MSVCRDGAPVDLGAPKQRALLAALALHAGRPVTAGALIDLMWGDDAPPAAAASLQTYVAGLRRALEPGRPARAAATVLVTTPHGYRLDLPPDALDAHRFTAAVERVHRAVTPAPPAAGVGGLLRDLDAALALWTGPAYADLRDDGPVPAERARLDELRLVAVEDRAVLRMARGEHAAVVADLTAAVREHPLRESLAGRLALALAGSGRQADALELLRSLRERLADELGVEPGAGLRAVELAVLRQEADGPAPPVAPVVPAARAGEWPLVGRRAELAALGALLDDAAAGRTAAGVLVGEPGVGKSRLLRELTAAARGRGLAVAVGRCSQDDGAPPYWPWRGVLRDLGADLAALGAPAPGGPDAGEGARFALWEAVCGVLRAHAPLLVVLDDLHWADASSLRLLRHVVDTLPAGGLAVVGARRALPEPAGALAELGETLARHGAARIAVGGLATGEVGELWRAATGAATAPAAAERLRDRTAGNPFFLTELLRAAPGGDVPDEVPAAVGDVVGGRVARLPAPARELLRAAAVAGRRFGLDELAAAAGRPAEAVLDDLEPALDAGLVAEDDAGAFRFSHALVRDAVYAALSPARRARAHAALAAPLADADPARAAHHWLRAGPAHAGRAWRAAVRAAGSASAVHAWEEAAALLRDAALAQQTAGATPLERYEVQVALADACRWAGDRAGVDSALLAAVAQARALGDVDREARAAAGSVDGAVWIVRPHGLVLPELVAALRDVLRRLPAADSEARCRVMLALAAELYFVDAPREREALVEQGLAVARRLGDADLLGWAYGAASLATVRPATAEARYGYGRDALAAARTPRQEVAAHTMLAFAAQETGRIDRMWEHLAAARAGAERMRLASVLVGLGWLEVPWLGLQGRFAEAEQLFGYTVQQMQRTSMPQSTETPAGTAMALRMAAGAVDATMVAQMQALAPVSPLPLDASIVVLMLRAGLTAEARAWHAAHGIDLSADDWFALLNTCHAAEAAYGVGDAELGVRAYRWLAPYAGRPCCASAAVALGPVDGYLALAAAAAGDRAAADRHAVAARALCLRWGIPLAADRLDATLNT
ncbi:hypothetical protein GCM10009524_14450 [Spirilliplanes yamanashiensis]